MAVTFGTMKTRIQTETNRPSAVNLTYIGDAIVTAIKFYEAKHIWFTEKKDTLSLTSGASTVDLPSDFKSITNLRLLNGVTFNGKGTGFDPKSIQYLEENWITSTLTTQPTEWALFNGKIYVNSISDATYTLYITYNYGDSTYPSASGDTSVWFGEGADVVRYEATAIFYEEYLHDYDLAAKARAAAGRYFQALIERNNSRSSEYTLA